MPRVHKARFHLDVSLRDTVTRVKRAGLCCPPAREWWQWWILCGAACSLGPPSLCAGTIRVSVFAFKLCYNDYIMAIRRKTFRGAALQLRAAAMLQRHIFLAMSIARMIFKIIRCQTCRLAAETIESSIVSALRWSLSYTRKFALSIISPKMWYQSVFILH